MRALHVFALLSALVSSTIAGSLDSSSSGGHTHHNRHYAKRGPGGWNSVTYPTGSTEAGIPVKTSNGTLELFALSKKGLDKTKLERIVFVIHGEGRDPWNYYSHMTTALKAAHTDGLVSDMNKIGIWAPAYWCNADQGVWPASEKHAKRKVHSNQMVWHNDDWNDGAPSIYPVNNNGVSAFTTLDSVIEYFGDATIFPNVKTIVISGHSMGAQMVQRYAALGTQPLVAPEVHYWIGNPASYLYFDERRPQKGVGGATSRSSCANYNDYKYGLNNINTNLAYNSPEPGKTALYNRYSSRFVHYAYGTKDTGTGSNACGARVQGNSHYNRGRIYQAYLTLLGYPTLHTLDYIRGISHVDTQMFAAKPSQYRLFVQNNSEGKIKANTAPKGVSDGLNVTFTGYSAKAATEMPGRRSIPMRLE